MRFWKSKLVNSGVLDIDVDFVEKRVGVNFPEKYVALMQEHNGGRIENNEFVYKDINGDTNTGSVNMLNLFDLLKEYIDPPEFFPKGLVPFADDGGGDLTCFDYRGCKENPPIVFWVCGDEEGDGIHFVANNFDEFINILY